MTATTGHQTLLCREWLKLTAWLQEIEPAKSAAETRLVPAQARQHPGHWYWASEFAPRRIIKLAEAIESSLDREGATA